MLCICLAKAGNLAFERRCKILHALWDYQEQCWRTMIWTLHPPALQSALCLAHALQGQVHGVHIA